MALIQKADLQARRRALVLLACATVVGAIAILLTRSGLVGLSDWILDDPERAQLRARLLAVTLAALFGLPTMAYAFYFYRVGERSIREKRFPPAGTAVTRDTPVLQGARARRRGQALKMVGFFLAFLAISFAVAVWRLTEMLDLSPG